MRTIIDNLVIKKADWDSINPFLLKQTISIPEAEREVIKECVDNSIYMYLRSDNENYNATRNFIVHEIASDHIILYCNRSDLPSTDITIKFLSL